MLFFAALLAAAAASVMPEGISTIDLLGKGWIITSGEHTINAALPAHALQALQDAGRVPNPLCR